jgi:tetratricopeptide (TPR) repeat protein
MRARNGAVVLIALLAAGCAPRTVVPALPSTLQYPEFVFPAVPTALAANPAAAGIDRGWRFLQNNDLRNADREFAAALQRAPQLYPAQAGAGYTALAQGEYERAVMAFDQALHAAPAYVPALVGRGQSLLGLNRDDEALRAFETALSADSSLADVSRRVDVLRFRVLQDVIEAARTATAAARLADAHAAYQRALAASPDSAFLHRELGLVERKQGDAASALSRFRRAADLDAGDAASLIQIAEILGEQRDFAGAEAAYRRAAAIEPSPDLERRIAAAAISARDARLPAEFRAIGGSATITRGELAALIGVRLEGTLRSAPVTEVVITDTADHWATPWITQASRAGVIEPFENHTFQPGATVTRGDLATAVSRLVSIIAMTHPELRSRVAERPAIVDMPPVHLSYPAAAVAITSGVMPLVDGGRFDVARSVTGAEAVEAIARLQALAASSR